MGGPAIIEGKEYKEFDNFYPAGFHMNNHFWCCSEHYFQAQKCFDEDYQFRIKSTMNAGVSWRMGQKCKLMEDWEEVKQSVMFDANLLKFTQNDDLKKLLLSTGNSFIIFRNSTDYWNVANSDILIRIRSILRWTYV